VLRREPHDVGDVCHEATVEAAEQLGFVASRRRKIKVGHVNGSSR
jgi:hypothetical protein